MSKGKKRKETIYIEIKDEGNMRDIRLYLFKL